MNRVPINEDGSAHGPGEILQTNLASPDDFILDNAGNAYVAQDALNELTEVPTQGPVKVLVGGVNDSYLAGPTSVQFGRTELDASVLYVATNGGLAAPVGGLYSLLLS